MRWDDKKAAVYTRFTSFKRKKADCFHVKDTDHNRLFRRSINNIPREKSAEMSFNNNWTHRKRKVYQDGKPPASPFPVLPLAAGIRKLRILAE